ncbi:hypothetical protein ACJX0J_013496, partial [Zea mays]
IRAINISIIYSCTSLTGLKKASILAIGLFMYEAVVVQQGGNQHSVCIVQSIVGIFQVELLLSHFMVMTENHISFILTSFKIQPTLVLTHFS